MSNNFYSCCTIWGYALKKNSSYMDHSGLKFHFKKIVKSMKFLIKNRFFTVFDAQYIPIGCIDMSDNFYSCCTIWGHALKKNSWHMDHSGRNFNFKKNAKSAKWLNMNFRPKYDFFEVKIPPRVVHMSWIFF